MDEEKVLSLSYEQLAPGLRNNASGNAIWTARA